MKGLNLDNTYGASALSSFIAAALFGFTFLQTYAYFIHRSGNDGPLLKLGVFLLWLLDGSQVMFLVWAVYYYLVQNFFFPQTLLNEHWSIPVMWLMSLLGNFAAEALFVLHIYNLSKRNKLVAASLSVVAVGQLIASAVVLRHMLVQINKSVVETAAENLVPVVLQQVCATLCNLAITGALCYYNYNPRDGFLAGLSVVDALILVCIDRGLIAAVVQLAYLLVYVFHDKTFLWLPLHVASSKLLVNALLAQLNAREIKPRKEAVGFNLGHLGARPMVPMNEQVMVVTTKTVLDTDAHSTSSKGGDLEGQTTLDK